MSVNVYNGNDRNAPDKKRGAVEIHIKNGAAHTHKADGSCCEIKSTAPNGNSVSLGDSKFDGSLAGLFGISCLMFLLTVCTLGIGLSWAICIELRWYIKHSRIDGRELYFDGTGWQLLCNSVKWGFLSLVTFGIYSMWVPLKWADWFVSHLHMYY